jgi:hypothetical protein
MQFLASDCNWRVKMTAVIAVTALAVSSPVAATSSYTNPSPQGNSWAPCGFAVDQLAAEGNGSAYGSCLGCDPTSFVCPSKCQSLIDALYAQCDGVYTPQDLFFDPAETLSGYWNDHLDALRVMAERCGCSGAHVVRYASHSVVLATILTLVALLAADWIG